MRVDKEESRIVCTKKSQVRIVVEMMLEGGGGTCRYVRNSV